MADVVRLNPFALGSCLTRRSCDAIARVLGPVLALLPLPGVAAWTDTITLATGLRPGFKDRAALLEAWLRNTLWSLSLAHWGDDEVLAAARISEADLAKLRSSLAGPGLVLALPHMGSWDLAGAWCARVGISVVSVAERLPDGMFERFSAARAAMGMKIYAVDTPELMGKLAEEVRAGQVVCLLSDRDLSARGLLVPWPGAEVGLPVPAGAAILARRTGAELRVVTCHFERGGMRMEVSDALAHSRPAALMADVVAGFAAAIRRHPTDWLMLRRPFR